MSTVIVTADVVDSTAVKKRYHESTAVKKIRAALEDLRHELSKVDPTLTVPVPYAGDSILLIGGTRPLEIFRAAVIHQAHFRDWWYGAMSIKIAIGYGAYVSEKDPEGVVSHHGSALDFLYGICNYCPPGRVVVTQSMRDMLVEAGFGDRLLECREQIKGFEGEHIFYEVVGSYEVPEGRRPPADARTRARWFSWWRIR